MTFFLPSDTRPGLNISLLAQSSLVGLAAIVGLLWLIFTSLAPAFVSSFNLFAISRSLAIDIVIGFSTMVVLATGGMNLAIGSIGVCSVMLAGYLMQRLGMPAPAALAAGLLLGALLGWTNGFAIVRSGVNSFVITLATASLYMGGMLILTKAVIYNEVPAQIAAFGRMRLGFVSPLLLIALAIAASLVVLFRLTALGREILTAGQCPRR
jgi:ribose transport system permease protein